MSFQTVPRHAPADVIKSSEWNIIADDLDYLNDQVESLKETLNETSKRQLMITCMSTINAGDAKEYAVGCKDLEGRTPMPLAGKTAKMRVKCSSNSLDADITITLRINGSDTSLTLTLSAGSPTGEAEAEILYSEGDELSIYVDASGASSGSITNLVIAIY